MIYGLLNTVLPEILAICYLVVLIWYWWRQRKYVKATFAQNPTQSNVIGTAAKTNPITKCLGGLSSQHVPLKDWNVFSPNVNLLDIKAKVRTCYASL